MKKNNLKAFIMNPWVSGIGVFVLGSLLLRCIDRIFNLSIYSTIGSLIKIIFISSLNFLNIKFHLPLWSLILIFLIGFLFCVLLELIAIKKGEPKEELLPFKKYREDKFDGVNYKWVYNENKIDHIRPYCPKDNCLLSHGHCLICRQTFITKDLDKLKILIIHKIENNLFS